MSRISYRVPPTYEQAQGEYYYMSDRGLYRINYDHETGTKILDDRTNLLERWPLYLTINGKQWPYLKVVFLMVYKRWPSGPVYYPHPPCEPSQIIEANHP